MAKEKSFEKIEAPEKKPVQDDAPKGRKINWIVVHCTATSPSTAVENIKHYWRTNLGWKSPGYHVIIDAWGKEHVLAEDEQVVNGVKGHNHDGLHVSYIGGVDHKGRAKDTRNEFQKEALINRLKLWRAKYPDAKILGHRDFSEDKNGNGIIDPWERMKECPSFDAITEYNFI